MDDIHARAPIDRVAVRVVMFAGEHFEPNKRVLTNDSETPHVITRITKAMRCNASFDDLTGTRFGRFVVLGLAREFKGSWVVRCDCGRYSTRKKKAITNTENVQDRCEHCRHLAYLQRAEYHRRTGKNKDINDRRREMAHRAIQDLQDAEKLAVNERGELFIVGGVMPQVYYNEHDKFAAAWLRELIRAGLIAPGIVDERSIEDVLPSELEGFTQCHFFAGIGVWSHALRSAGWPDDRKVWTGSCPCQPFSAAGKGDGFADERHLWPAFHHLVAQCKPTRVFGEQVASKAVDDWIDLVQADMEAVGYAFGSVPFPSAGVGAPHIRDRNFWVADSTVHGYNRAAARRSTKAGEAKGRLLQLEGCGTAGGLEYDTGDGREQRRSESGGRSVTCGCGNGGLADYEGERCGETRASGRRPAQRPCNSGELGGLADRDEQQRHRSRYIWDTGRGEPANLRAMVGGQPYASPTNGFWRDADWLYCRDGKWRPVEPSTFPLAHGAAARVGRLRGYGNAINAEAAKAFIQSYLEIDRIALLIESLC